MFDISEKTLCVSKFQRRYRYDNTIKLSRSRRPQFDSVPMNNYSPTTVFLVLGGQVEEDFVTETMEKIMKFE